MMTVIISKRRAMNVILHCTAVLLLIVTSYGAHGSSRATRLTRQVNRGCESGSSCVLLGQCPALNALLRRPTRDGLNRLRSLGCGFEKRRAKVCCPSTPETLTSRAGPSDSPPPSAASEALLPSYCGHAVSRDKIHGGTPVPLGAYPWMAVLGFTTSK
ncbi:phenoloxidase-activating enzyme 1 [Hyalella azteca]|uniref:Phenoloxidase-activating enzyme 1 n=1 Tax=Hyalella azteca TaxID=294128 RepID=A0A8B7N887_HYAAZ|nr:phenoloxidase-activating enzyme 1 [Hyalella azteca]